MKINATICKPTFMLQFVDFGSLCSQSVYDYYANVAYILSHRVQTEYCTFHNVHVV